LNNRNEALVLGSQCEEEPLLRDASPISCIRFDSFSTDGRHAILLYLNKASNARKDISITTIKTDRSREDPTERDPLELKIEDPILRIGA